MRKLPHLGASGSVRFSMSARTERDSLALFRWLGVCILPAVSIESDQLAERARHFAVRILKFARTLPRGPAFDPVVRQLAASATSVAANYRAARARSRAEFIAKIGLVAEEADESEHWLEVLEESGTASGSEFDALRRESRELRAIFVASATTARKNHRRL